MPYELPAGDYVRCNVSTNGNAAQTVEPVWYDRDGNQRVIQVGERIVIYSVLVSMGSVSNMFVLWQDTNANGAFTDSETLLKLGSTSGQQMIHDAPLGIHGRRLGSNNVNRLYFYVPAGSGSVQVNMYGVILPR